MNSHAAESGDHFTDEQLDRAFEEMAFGKSEMTILDLSRFYSAIGEDVTEEEVCPIN